MPGAVTRSTTGSIASSVLRYVCRRNTCPDSRPITPRIGGRSLSNVPCPLNLLPRRRGGSSGSGCGRPFSPAFWYISSASTTRSRRAEGGKAFEGHALNAVSELEQVPSAQAQFLRQMERGDALAGVRLFFGAYRAGTSPAPTAADLRRGGACPRPSVVGKEPHPPGRSRAESSPDVRARSARPGAVCS